MKRRDLIRKLEEMGCVFVRHGAVAFESCQYREILNGMLVTSTVTLTVALIRNEGNRIRQPIREELTMKVHEFTLILTADPNEEESDRLYSIFDDGTLATIAGVPQIHFHREALSLEEAIGSALVNVRKAGFDVVRVEIEPKIVAQGTQVFQAEQQLHGTNT